MNKSEAITGRLLSIILFWRISFINATNCVAVKGGSSLTTLLCTKWIFDDAELKRFHVEEKLAKKNIVVDG